MLYLTTIGNENCSMFILALAKQKICCHSLALRSNNCSNVLSDKDQRWGRVIIPAKLKSRSTGAEDDRNCIMLHKESFYNWVSIQHFQILLAIIKKLQHFQVTLVVCCIWCRLSWCHFRVSRVGECKIVIIGVFTVSWNNCILIGRAADMSLAAAMNRYFSRLCWSASCAGSQRSLK